MDDAELMEYYAAGGDLSALEDSDLSRLRGMIFSQRAGQTPFAPLAEKPFPDLPPSVGFTGSDPVTDAISMGGRILETGVSFVPNPLLRTILSGAVSAPLGYMEGGVEGARDRAASNMALEVGGTMLGQQLPRMGLNAGLWTGTIGTQFKEKIDDVTDAFLRVRDHMGQKWGGAVHELPIGAQRRTKAVLKDESDRLAHTEMDIPGNPIDIRQGDRALNPYRQQLDQRSSLPITFNTDVDMISGQILSENIANRGWNPMLTTREGSELMRGIRQEPGPEDIIKMRDAGVPVPPGEAVKAQTRATIARNLDDQRRAAGYLHYGDDRLDKQTQMVHDLLTMKNTNTAMRGGGTVFGSLPAAGIRAGMAAPIGGGLTSMLGGDFSTGAQLSGLLGLLLSPSNLSRAGFMGGRLAENAPFAVRTADTAREAERQRLRRRDPQEDVNGRSTPR